MLEAEQRIGQFTQMGGLKLHFLQIGEMGEERLNTAVQVGIAYFQCRDVAEVGFERGQCREIDVVEIESSTGMWATHPRASLPASNDFVGGAGFVANMHRTLVEFAHLHRFKGRPNPVIQAVSERFVFFVQRLKPGQPFAAVKAL